ncbi:MAG TPA: starch synthase, partial [Porticoccaceae bacterium]|nr:starch synthase [Porticoccaceae bacterium]
LPEEVKGVPLWDFRALEFYGELSYIKGGIVFADAVNTVSPGYAQEVLTPEFGCGLDGLLRHCGAR